MTRHSRNNTAGAFFTSAEKSKLVQYGTQQQRLGRDSMRKPHSCTLCLEVAVDGVVCTEGHLFCRECILKNILTQKQNIKKEVELYEEEKRRRIQEAEEAALDEKRRQIEQFERTSLAVADGGSNKRAKTGDTLLASGGKKDMSAFWLPAKAPQEKETLKEPCKTTFCPASKHPILVKQLLPIKWTKTDDNDCVCSSCRGPFIRGVDILIVKPCGHCVCGKCIKLLKSSGDKDKCPICDTCFSLESDLLKLATDGTGFASAGGTVLAKKYDHAFV